MMKKTTMRLSAAAVVMLMLLTSAFSVFAVGFDYNDHYLLSDEADLFSTQNFNGLKEKLDSVGSQTGWQIAVVTTLDNIAADRMDSYYNSFYDNNRSYFKNDSVLFVIDQGSGNRIILTHGAAEAYFTDQRLDEMKSALKPYLQSSDWINAAYTFADKTLEFYKNGIPANGSHENHVEGTETESEKLRRENKLLYVLTKWGWLMGLIALAGGGIFVGVNVGRYKYNGKSGTYDLRENSSLRLVDSQDVFVTKNTTYTTINTSSGSSGSSGGGSSSHGSSGSF